MSKLKTTSNPTKSKRERKPDSRLPVAAVERVEDTAHDLQEAGIIDAKGSHIRKDLSVYTQEDRDRDRNFGG